MKGVEPNPNVDGDEYVLGAGGAGIHGEPGARRAQLEPLSSVVTTASDVGPIPSLGKEAGK